MEGKGKRVVGGLHMVVLAGVIAAALCIVGAASAQPAWANGGTQQLTPASIALSKGQTFTKGGNTYKVIGLGDDADDLDEVMLVKYGSNSKKPTVNKVTYRGITYEIERIGKNAFNNAKGHKITKLTLGKCVDEVGAKAFYGCKKLKRIDLSKADLIDIDRGRNGYYLDDIDIGANAFKKAGVATVTVKCGVKNVQYRKLVKKALVKKGMRSSVTVVK